MESIARVSPHNCRITIHNIHNHQPRSLRKCKLSMSLRKCKLSMSFRASFFLPQLATRRLYEIPHSAVESSYKHHSLVNAASPLVGDL